MSQSEDIEAINTYVVNLQMKTPTATKLKTDWQDWYANLSWWSKTTDSDAYNDARSRRNAINIANAITAADKAAVQNTLQHGLTTEEMGTGGIFSDQSAPRPNIDLVSGKVTAAPKPVAGSVTHATIRQGSKGADVIAWQQIIGVGADGTFGAGTTAATKKFQTAHGLNSDGVVGPMTWSAAVGKPVTEAPVAKVSASGAAALINTKRGQTVTPTPTPKPNIATGGKAATASSSGAIASAKSKIQTVEAGMFGGLGNVPLWMKILIGIGVIGGVGFGVKHQHEAVTLAYSPNGKPIRRNGKHLTIAEANHLLEG